MEEFEVQIKVVILGNPDVGKSSILQRYITGQCNESTENTIGAKFMGKIVKVNETVVKLNIWDTAGQERYQSFSKLYCRDAGAVILVYDVSDPETFGGMQKWYDMMAKDILPSNSLLFIAGNKCDLIESPGEIEANVKEYAEAIKAEYFRVSAKSGLGIEALFGNISSKYVKNMKYEKRSSIYLRQQSAEASKHKKKKKFC